MTRPTGYKIWTLNLGLLILATALFVANIASAVDNPHPVTLALVLIFGGFMVWLFWQFVRAL